jgi:hypothetical protein
MDFKILKKIAAAFQNGDIDEHLTEVIELLEIYDDLKSNNEQSGWHPFRKMIIDLLESAGLMPYVIDNIKELSLIDILRLMPYEMEEGKFFHHGQIQLLDDLLDDKITKLAIVAPTSFGKTRLVDYYIQMKKPNKVIIIQPTIALLQETYSRLSSNKILSEYSIFIDTEEFNFSINKWVAIWTQERCLEWINSQEEKISHVDLLVIDEFYLIDPKRNLSEDPEVKPDDERAEILKYVYRVLGTRSYKALLLGPVADSINDNSGVTRRESKYTPVRQIIKDEYTRWENLLPDKAEEVKFNRLVEIINESKEGLLVFRPSPDKAQSLVRKLIDTKVKPNFTIHESVLKLIGWLKENYPATVEEWTVYKALNIGIGIHHGKMPRSLQKLILILFNQGHLHTLIMTPTIVQGVNTTAKSLVYWKNTKEGKSIDYFAYKNIIGRAGRLGFHITGVVHLFDKPPFLENISIEIPNIELDTISVKNDTIDTSLILSQETIQDIKKEFPALKTEKMELAFHILEKHSKYFPIQSMKIFFDKTDKEIVNEFLGFCDPKIKISDLRFKSIIKAMNKKTNQTFVKKYCKNDVDKAYSQFFERLNRIQFELPKGLSILFKVAQTKNLMSKEKSEKILKEAIMYSRFQTPSAVYSLDEQGIPFHISYKILEKHFKNASETKLVELKNALYNKEIRKSTNLTDNDIFILDNILKYTLKR